MTVKEISLAAGCNKDTVIDTIKKQYPDLIQHGKTTRLTFEQSKKIMELLPKRNMVELKENSISELKENSISLIVSETIKGIMPIIQTMINENNRLMFQNQTQPRIEYKQDYFGIIGYANKHGIKDLPFTDALKLGKIASSLSRDKGKEIRKIDDERFGQVNSYHIDILKDVFGL
jgi:hypothetical protein